MPRGKYERKAKPTGKAQPAKRRAYKKGELLPPTLSQQPPAAAIAGDQPDPEINMPVNKSDLMLIALALQQYRLTVQQGGEFSSNVKHILVHTCAKLELKVASNEASWDSLFGNQNG